MRARALALVVVGLALAGCGGSADPFSYDRSAPLDLRTQATRSYGRGIVVREVSFASRGDRVPAYLVVPPGAGRRPAVVFLHGATGSRDDFLAEAVLLATHGAVTLTLTSGYERSTDPRVRANTEPVSVDRLLWVRSVIDVRRALDLLRARADVDPERLGVVGYSRGVQWAGVAGGLEHVAAVVLMGGRAHPSENVLPARDRGLVRPLDTARYVGRIAPGRLLVQGGRYDDVVPPAEVKALYAAAREPKKLRWYPTGHEFGGQTLNDQLAFLVRVLGLR